MLCATPFKTLNFGMFPSNRKDKRLTIGGSPQTLADPMGALCIY